MSKKLEHIKEIKPGKYKVVYWKDIEAGEDEISHWNIVSVGKEIKLGGIDLEIDVAGKKEKRRIGVDKNGEISEYYELYKESIKFENSGFSKILDILSES